MSIDPSPVYPAARGVYEGVKATVKPKTANFEFIGKNMPRYDAYPKSAGTAMYTRDVQLPGMLYAQYLVCPYPHAKVTAIDTSKAEALPGVRAVLRYDTADVFPPITKKFSDIVGLIIRLENFERILSVSQCELRSSGKPYPALQAVFRLSRFVAAPPPPPTASATPAATPPAVAR